MLHRDLYRGVVVWGKRGRIDKGGRVGIKVARPESEWKTFPRPELALVSPELWAAVQARLAEVRASYLRTPAGELLGRPQVGIESANLLTGFTSCSLCGGSMVVAERGSRANGAAYRYLRCGTNWHRGAGACRNNLSVPTAEADRAVLEVLKAEVLDGAVIAQALDLAAKQYVAKPEELDAKRTAAEVELRKVDAELSRLVEALAGGEGISTIAAGIKARERRKAELQATLEHLDGLSRAPRMDSDKVKAELEKRLADWQSVLLSEPVKARQILRKLIAGRLVLTPDKDGRAYHFAGKASLGRVLEGVAGDTFHNRAGRPAVPALRSCGTSRAAGPP